ncbi:hypothetical protein ERJ75_001185100 [Trypanosoma vivax]|nr:hypothetical protein ERJ75_001185100 [Trypanosoma vivax]
MAASDEDAQGGNARLGREARPHSAASEAWHRRESGTNWPPGWRTRAERTSTGTRGERLVEKTQAQGRAKGVAHNESPASRRTKAQVGRMVERGRRTKVSEGQQRRLGVTQGRKYCGASHATLDAAREEQQRSRLQRARRERVVARRQSEACGGGGQSNDGSARPRKGQKKGARRVVMSKEADEQGAKVTQQWRLNGKGAQGDALPLRPVALRGTRGNATRRLSPGPSRERPCEHASARGRACNHVQQPADSIERHAWSSPRDGSRKAVTLRAGKWARAPPAKRGRKARHWRRVKKTLTKRGECRREKHSQTEARRGRRTAKRG